MPRPAALMALALLALPLGAIGAVAFALGALDCAETWRRWSGTRHGHLANEHAWTGLAQGALALACAVTAGLAAAEILSLAG